MRNIIAALFLCVVSLVGCDSANQQSAQEQTSAREPTGAAETESGNADIRGEEVSYQVGDTTFKGYIAYDANQEGQRPGVLVVHEWWGHNEYVRTRAHMLARMGYTAMALDMYGDGKQAAHPEDAQKFMSEVMGNMELMQRRFTAAQEQLEQHPTTSPAQIAAIGYCMGGAVVLTMAREGADLAGVASFHGNLGTEDPAQPGEITADILVLHGADDPFVPQEQVEAFKAEMEAAGANYEFIGYPGAVHGFTNPGATALGEEFDLPLAYDESADEQSWAELEQFLQDVFSEQQIAQ
ncbi:dienelactone hydrolase family protein [Gilvimarinus sp. F26214L]|uniref:dienelactone hydrolase family protein n=1 Tax=Gilvimarinus sp. DZF01 TaxID=3461371 RepID=UPI0040461C16